MEYQFQNRKEIFCELRTQVLFAYIVKFRTDQKMLPLILKNREVTFFLIKVVWKFLITIVSLKKDNFFHYAENTGYYAFWDWLELPPSEIKQETGRKKLFVWFPDASMHIDPHKIFTREVMSTYEKGKEHRGRAQKCESFLQTELGKMFHMQNPWKVFEHSLLLLKMRTGQ